MSQMIRNFLNCVLFDPFECSKKSMDKPKQERVWMVIDSPHCILIYQLFLWKSVIYHSILKLPFDAEVDEKFLNGIQTVSIDYYQ